MTPAVTCAATVNARDRSIERLERLPALRDAIRGCEDVGSLFARSAELARVECGFDRVIVAALEGNTLTAIHSDVLEDPASDLLRRRLLDEPIPVLPGTLEAQAVRGKVYRAGAAPSELVRRLGLAECAVAPIAPERQPLALLIADRAAPAVQRLDHVLLSGFGALVAMALEHQVLEARLDELSREVRHAAVGLQAFIGEVRRAPIQLPHDGGGRAAFPLFSGVPVHEGPGIRDLLTEREATIAALLAEGRSNRDIAEHLFLSPETVKGYVARILRKLGASNRAEAVARYLNLRGPS